MIGRTISHYQIVERLGAGGMGIVYKAHQLNLPRTVALKFLPRGDEESGDRLTRLRTEARAISKLNHAHIATLYEFEETDGQCFLVLEYLPGGTLRDKIREKKKSGEFLPLDVVLSYACQIAEGLAYAHRHKIIHRDVKSDNVMLTDEGVLKLTDFGLAKLEGEAGITKSGMTPGTMAYMAPELLHGKPADSRTDIFSFGVVLYEMLIGRLPFSGDEIPALMHSILYDEPAPVSEVRPNVPAGLDQIVAKALEKNPNQRYQRMEDLLAELDSLAKRIQLLGNEALTSTAVEKKGLISSHLSATRQFIARRPLWQKIVGGVVFAALMILAGALPFGQRFSNLFWTVAVDQPFNVTVQRFENVTNIQEDEHLLVGLAFFLNSKLQDMSASYKGISVLYWSEPEKGLKPTELYKRYGVNFVVTGSFQHYGDVRRMTLDLVEARTARLVRSRHYEKVAVDLLEMQDLILRDLRGFLELEFKPEAVAYATQGSPRKPGVYELYLRALGILHMERQPGNFDEAIHLLQQAVKTDPEYVMACMELSNAYQMKYESPDGKDPQLVELAQKYAEKALQLSPEMAETHTTMAWVYRLQGKNKLVLYELEEALKYAPEDSRIFRLRARANWDLGKDKEAEEDFHRAIELKPNSTMALIDFGAFLARKGKIKEAEEIFNKVLSIAPEHFMANENLAGVLLYQGKYKEAVAFGERALKIYPSPKTYNNVATGYYYLKQYDKAAEVFLAATQNSKDHRMWRGLGDACLQIPGKENEAKKAFLKAAELAWVDLEVNPKNAGAHCQLAVYLAKGGEFSKAKQEAEVGLKLNPNDAPNKIQAALVYELVGERGRAIEHLKSAIGKNKEVLISVANDPEFDSLTRDPRFKHMANQIRLIGAKNSLPH